MTGFFSTSGLLFTKPLFCNSFFIGYSVISRLFYVLNLSGKVTRLLICRSFGFWFDFEGHAGLFENVMGAVFFVSNMINCFPEHNRSRTVQPIGIKFLLPERSRSAQKLVNHPFKYQPQHYIASKNSVAIIK